jgi:hypothetical protein
VVEAPTNGFVFPAFIERSTDVNSIMYYTKNPKETHPELMEHALGCYKKQTATIQKEAFQSIIKDSLLVDEDEADKIFMEVQENLNTMIEEYNATYEDVDPEPIILNKKDVQNLLIESGIPEEVTIKIEKSYEESFGKDLPLAESLIDSKALKVKAQLNKEESLKKQVQVLQNKLELAKQEVALDKDIPLSTESDEETVTLEEASVTGSEDEENIFKYDVILQVKPEKIPQIKSQIIDGQKCIVIPINDNEQTTVNGQDDLI